MAIVSPSNSEERVLGDIYYVYGVRAVGMLFDWGLKSHALQKVSIKAQIVSNLVV
jgi:hypothetical protein